MRAPSILAAAMLWQSALLVNIGGVATPDHLRFQRPILVQSSMAGTVACAELDATVLGHTASAAHDDLRLFRQEPGEAEAETPYALTESGPEPVTDTEAHVEHLHVERAGGKDAQLSFDLRMPDRPFSAVELRLATQNFVGTATASGVDRRGHRTELGSFGVFDLSDERLGRWTVLPMAETTLPVVHVNLAMRTPAGAALDHLSTSWVAGATVPASRESGTLYLPVAETTALVRNGPSVSAALHLAAHVPVERVTVMLEPGAEANLLGEVDLFAKPDNQPSADTEAIAAGSIEQVRMPAGDPRLNPIDVRRLDLDATVGATLGSPATVRVVVRNPAGFPLPIREIALEMRERKLCFVANPGTNYTLRYGDPTLVAPVYDGTEALVSANPATAQLGPEKRNPHFVSRRDPRPYLQRHPEVIWLAVLVCAGFSGGMVLHRVQPEGM